MGLGCFNPPAPTDSRIDWLFDCNYCPPVQAVRETAGVAYRTRGGAPLAYRGLAASYGWHKVIQPRHWALHLLGDQIRGKYDENR